MRVHKAVIPAAGLGTRFLPATKALPKEMLPLVDKPIIQYVVEEAIAAGIDDILVITGRGKRAIEDHFDRSIELESFLSSKNDGERLHTVKEIGDLADIHFVRQKEPLGLGHAVLQAKQHVGNEPFAVLLGDDVCVSPVPATQQLLEIHQQFGGSVVGVQPVPYKDVSRYGIISPEPIGPHIFRALDLIEKPAVHEAPSNLAIIGRYVLDPSVFEKLEQTPAGRNGELQLTDALRLLNTSQSVYAYEPATRRFDVGDKLGLIMATVELALGRSDIGKELRDYLLELIGAKNTAGAGA